MSIVQEFEIEQTVEIPNEGPKFRVLLLYLPRTQEYFVQSCNGNGVCIILENCGPEKEYALICFNAEIIYRKVKNLYECGASKSKGGQ